MNFGPVITLMINFFNFLRARGNPIFRGSIPLTQMNQTQPPNQITTNQSSNTTTLMKPTDSTSAVVFGGGANESDSDDSEISAFVQDTQQPAEIIDERLG